MALNSNGRMKAKAVRLTAIAHALTFNINPRQGACWDQKVIHSDTPRKVLATCLCIISHTLYETVFTVAPPPAQQSSDKKIVLFTYWVCKGIMYRMTQHSLFAFLLCADSTSSATLPHQQDAALEGKTYGVSKHTMYVALVKNIVQCRL